MKDKFIYTIIIPHKNIPDLLQRCMDSIPYRDDTQIIIVDDDSDPAIVDFVRFPGQDRPNTEIYFTKENKGAGYARNVGLQHAKGRWLVFADADDFFMPCFNDMLDTYKDNENDIIYFKLTSVDSKTLAPHTRHKYINKVLSKIKKTNDWNIIVEIAPVWGKFIKRKVVEQNNISFQEVQYSNDVLFSAKLQVLKIRQIIDEHIIYSYTYRKGSLTEYRTIESLCTRFQVASDCSLYFKESGYRKRKYIYRKVIHYWIYIFLKNPLTGISLFPQLLKTCGLWYTIICFINSLSYYLKRRAIRLIEQMLSKV
jgi:glycosyltransferase involved in cell wall biosynthesis